jgi:ribosomal protein S18 acetylase RimI-like enzyme
MNENDFRIEKERLYGVENGYRYTLYNKNNKECSSLEVEKECFRDKFCNLRDDFEKDVLYICNFNTNSRHRNKGYGRALLQNIINRYKGKYELIHLNVCPFFEHEIWVEEDAVPKNGLDKDRLLKFYESFGFRKYHKQVVSEKYVVMIMEGKSGE